MAASDYFSWDKFGTDAARKQYTGNAAWGSGELANGNVSQVQAALQQFVTSFRNLTGRNPSQEEIGSFASGPLYQSWNAPGDLTYSDNSNLANNYIENSFGPDIAGHQQQLQTDQFGKTQKMIEDLIQKQTQATAGDLTNPNSPTYQGFAGNMNNLGITPSSGAFQGGLGGVLGQSAAQSQNAALGAVGLPTISNIQGINQNPFSFASKNSDLSHLNSTSDFGLQADLARQLFGNGGSNIVGQISSLLQGGGAAGTGAGNFYSGTKGKGYICTEMIQRGLLCESDFEDFYSHVFPTVLYKGRAFWNYSVHGKTLVNIANEVYPGWAEDMKPLFFDRVMAEKDPFKSIDLYSDALKRLCSMVAPDLWDERNMRRSLFDSLWFLPRLLTCETYRKNFWTLLRIKMLFLYDKPRCGRHYA